MLLDKNEYLSLARDIILYEEKQMMNWISSLPIALQTDYNLEAGYNEISTKIEYIKKTFNFRYDEDALRIMSFNVKSEWMFRSWQNTVQRHFRLLGPIVANYKKQALIEKMVEALTSFNRAKNTVRVAHWDFNPIDL